MQRLLLHGERERSQPVIVARRPAESSARINNSNRLYINMLDIPCFFADRYQLDSG